MSPAGVVDARRIIRTVAMQVTDVTVLLLALTVAMVAVARGASRWLAYALVVVIGTVTTAAVGLAFDPADFLYRIASPRWVAVTYALGLSMLAAPAVVYVVQSNAAQSANALRRLETERMTEAERLAQQRLQTQLATIDHDLVLTALRLARAAPPRAEALLAAVSTYLRAAQQRESSDPDAVATSLAALRGLCASPGSASTQESA